jgi:hypothetical protein
MVESTPYVVYDSIEVYKQQGLSETSGRDMLLQAEMNKKKQAAKKEMEKYDIDIGSLAPGEIKNAHRLYKLPYKVESIFMTCLESTSRIRFMGAKAEMAQSTLSFSSRRR